MGAQVWPQLFLGIPTIGARPQRDGSAKLDTICCVVAALAVFTASLRSRGRKSIDDIDPISGHHEVSPAAKFPALMSEHMYLVGACIIIMLVCILGCVIAKFCKKRSLANASTEQPPNQ